MECYATDLSLGFGFCNYYPLWLNFNGFFLLSRPSRQIQTSNKELGDYQTSWSKLAKLLPGFHIPRLCSQAIHLGMLHLCGKGSNE